LSIAVLPRWVLVSLLGRGKEIDTDKLLKRGKYAVKTDHVQAVYAEKRGLRFLGIGKEFSFWDKVIYIVTFTWVIGWFITFIVGTFINLIFKPSDLSWMKFWYVYITIYVVAAIIITVWFTIGGINDIKSMFSTLRTMERDHADDGRVVDH